MNEVIKKSSMLLRLTEHDGMPVSSVEFMFHNRQVLTNTAMPYAEIYNTYLPYFMSDVGGATIIDHKDKLIQRIRRLKKCYGSLTYDWNKIEVFYKDYCSVDKFKESINLMLERKPVIEPSWSDEYYDCGTLRKGVSLLGVKAIIAESFESILNSTEKDIELIVVDDCSTDYSLDILEHYAKKDKRVKLIKNSENLGISKTYNKATEAVCSDIILVAASDDVYDYNRAKWAIRAFKKFDADIIYWPFWKAQEKTIPESPEQGVVLAPFEKKLAPNFDSGWLKKVDGQFIGHGFTAYKSNVGRSVKYREDLRHGIDHHFFLDCWKAGFKFQNIEGDKEMAGTYRFYIKMVSQQFREEILKQDYALEKEYSDVKKELADEKPVA